MFSISHYIQYICIYNEKLYVPGNLVATSSALPGPCPAPITHPPHLPLLTSSPSLSCPAQESQISPRLLRIYSPHWPSGQWGQTM